MFEGNIASLSIEQLKDLLSIEWRGLLSLKASYLTLLTTYHRIIKDWLLQLVVVWVEIIDNSLTSCCCYRSHNCSWFRRVVFFILDVIRHPTRITVIIPIERIIIHKISSVVCLEHLEELIPRNPIFLFIHKSPCQNIISQTLKFGVFPWFIRVFGYVI